MLQKIVDYEWYEDRVGLFYTEKCGELQTVQFFKKGKSVFSIPLE